MNLKKLKTFDSSLSIDQIYYLYKTHSWCFLFIFFSYLSGLKPNLKKSEIGALKEVQVAVCGLRYIDTLKIMIH